MTALTETEKLACNDYMYHIKPAPDGRPWAKCCSGPDQSKQENTCCCLMKRPPGGASSRYEAHTSEDGICYFLGMDQLKTEKGRFFCVHRSTDDGFHRECAGWAAKITGNRP